MKHRFYFAQGEKLQEVVEKLESKEYFQLTDAGTALNKLIIDTELMQFWLTDQKHFESNISIIKDKHNEVFHELDFLEIENL